MSIKNYLVRISYGANSYLDLGCFFLFIWLAVNAVFYSMERIIFGEAFTHFGDVILGFITGYLFSYCCYIKAQFKIKDDFINHEN